MARKSKRFRKSRKPRGKYRGAQISPGRGTRPAISRNTPSPRNLLDALDQLCSIHLHFKDTKKKTEMELPLELWTHVAEQLVEHSRDPSRIAYATLATIWKPHEVRKLVLNDVRALCSMKRTCRFLYTATAASVVCMCRKLTMLLTLRVSRLFHSCERVSVLGHETTDCIIVTDIDRFLFDRCRLFLSAFPLLRIHEFISWTTSFRGERLSMRVKTECGLFLKLEGRLTFLRPVQRDDGVRGITCRYSAHVKWRGIYLD